MTINRGRRAVAAAILLGGLAACAATRPTAFYTLSSDATPKQPRSTKGMVIGLGPVSLPAYLDRPDIVTREGMNEMRLAEFNRWAEPLEPLLARIMAQDLYALLDAQAYRLCFWRVASDEINYRRFFDVNELSALSAEHEEVLSRLTPEYTVCT